MIGHMVDYVMEKAQGEDGDVTHLVDCYCGSGLFCLSASKDFDVCVGIEVNDKAVSEATDNAKLNNIKNCEFIAASAEQIFMGGKVRIRVGARSGATILPDVTSLLLTPCSGPGFPQRQVRRDHRPAQEGGQRGVPGAAAQVRPQENRLYELRPRHAG